MAAARGNADSAAVLLGARGPVRKAIIGGDVVELRGRLVVPRAPCGRAVFGDNGALIAGENHAFRVAGINPELVIIIAARRASDGRPILAAISGPVERSVRNVNRFRISRVHSYIAEVPAAAPDAFLVRHFVPGSTGVVRTINAAFFGVDNCVHEIRVCGSDGDSNSANTFGGQASGELLPGVTGVRGFEYSAAGAVGRRINTPRWATRIPKRGVNRPRVLRIKCEVDSADVIALVQNPFPTCAAISGAIYATFRVRAVSVTKSRNENDVRILRVHKNAAYLSRIIEANVGPGFACVC